MRKVLYIGAITLAAAFLAIPAIPGLRRGNISATRSFSIDGQRYLLDPSLNDDLSGIREELHRLRIHTPTLRSTRPINRFFAEGIRKIGDQMPDTKPQIPPGLRAERVIRTNSDASSVEMAVGTMERHGPETRRRLTDSGWDCFIPVPGRTAVTIKNKGRETTIVLLEENEGKFLLIRRLE